MTPNTIAYASLMEEKRHNIASEKQNLTKLSNDFSLGRESNRIAAHNAYTNRQNAYSNRQNALANLMNVQSNAQKWVAELAQTKVRDQQNYITNQERNRLQKYATDVTKYLGEIDAEIKRERSDWEEEVAYKNAESNKRNAESNAHNAGTNARRQQKDAEELDFRRKFDEITRQMDWLFNVRDSKRNKKKDTWGNVNNSVKSIGSLISGIGGIFGKGKGK